MCEKCFRTCFKKLLENTKMIKYDNLLESYRKENGTPLEGEKRDTSFQKYLKNEIGLPLELLPRPWGYTSLKSRTQIQPISIASSGKRKTHNLE